MSLKRLKGTWTTHRVVKKIILGPSWPGKANFWDHLSGFPKAKLKMVGSNLTRLKKLVSSIQVQGKARKTTIWKLWLSKTIKKLVEIQRVAFQFKFEFLWMSFARNCDIWGDQKPLITIRKKISSTDPKNKKLLRRMLDAQRKVYAKAGKIITFNSG